MQAVGDEFKRHVHEVLEKKGWPEKSVTELIEVAAQCSLSAANLAERLEERMGEKAARDLLTAILAESENLVVARARLRRSVQAKFYLPHLLFQLRGMLVALKGDGRMDSPLQSHADELLANPRTMQPIKMPDRL